MAITPARFQLTHIDPNQLTPTVTANEALNELDTGVNGTVDVDVNAGGTITLSNDDYRQYMEFNLRGDLGSPDGPLADFILEIPSGTSGAFFVTNTTSFNCQVQTAGIGSPQVSVNVASNDTLWCFSDGTNVIAAGGQDGAAGAAGADGADGTDGVSTVRAQNYETFRSGTLSDNQVIHRWIFAKQTTFAADFANSYAFAGVVPTGAVTLRIMQGDSGSPSPTQVGSIDFGAGGEWGTFSMTGSPTEPITVNAGQYLEIQGPGPADATLADLSLNLQGSGSSFRGALVYLTTNYSIPHNTYTSVPFDVVSEDTDNFFLLGSPESDATRLTIGAGITRVQLFGQVHMAGSAAGSSRAVQIYKNNAALTPAVFSAQNAAEANQPGIQAFTAALSVVENDYFELRAIQDTGGALNVLGSASATWFSIRVIE